MSQGLGCLLTWVLLRTLLGRRRIALAVILHGPVRLVQPTSRFTLLGAISLHRRVVRVGSVALVMSRLVGHECGRVHAHLRERSWCDATRVRPGSTSRYQACT
jgi:hypothetical protein